ncbi:MAG: transposase [Candidatus Marinimicrobia bacterium]|nr:transposase [Candidatus Neomarinimicrobiota bacterium]
MNSVIIEAFNHYRYVYGVQFYGYVIMPNHIHYIAQFQQEKYGLSDFTRDFKSTVSKKIHDRLALVIDESSFPINNIFRENNLKIKLPMELRDFLLDSGKNAEQEIKLWRDDEKPIILETEEMGIQRLNYLHDNPVRKGWVETPEEYTYSSASFYLSGKSFPFRVTHLFDEK